MRNDPGHSKAQVRNLEVYRRPRVVSHYASLDYLTPCERCLFDACLRPGMAVLDIGVGGGRTASRLAEGASRYVGVDYSEEMIRRCRAKFPQLDFRVVDAADLSAFTTASFDAVVMAFNALDYVIPQHRRQSCLRECSRVLKPDGVLLFSSHNPRSILVRPGWDSKRTHTFVRRWMRGRGMVFQAAVKAAGVTKAWHAVLRAAAGSVSRMVRRVPTPAFWRGDGYLYDPAHGGLMTHYATPEHVIEEVEKFGFCLQRLLGDDYPKRSHGLVTDWYYYAFTRMNHPASPPCA